mgnify:CR=1 FL=1
MPVYIGLQLISMLKMHFFQHQSIVLISSDFQQEMEDAARTLQGAIDNNNAHLSLSGHKNNQSTSSNQAKMQAHPSSSGHHKSPSSRKSRSKSGQRQRSGKAADMAPQQQTSHGESSSGRNRLEQESRLGRSDSKSENIDNGAKPPKEVSVNRTK